MEAPKSPAPPPITESFEITPPSAVSVAASSTSWAAVMSTSEIHTNRPSATESPSRAYSMTGSYPSAAAACSHMSSALRVNSWVLVTYVSYSFTDVMRSWCVARST
ncbi:uncharacterized protein PITG_04030 [Phytophthora infestans T30-4]|uniref:Uncharacterized protein n=1 Tax=Phytophthora infestans (strain T30-4) TaxID=403677 RepID=D0N0D5_PHYIT|nr:uncharacterized protein PITG_04030 [Phytophthora infestans T30-4]EEY67098.1 hypothetical protein PITG_04030 [Phytophthora infestans T30-4]|eukprot:XP_002905746.1 hypothetical protein PITG_04030 [Phytophthora infestans T30-4]